MILYIAWTPTPETFDQGRHQQDSHRGEILSFSLTHTENKPAKVVLWMRNTLKDLLVFQEKKYALISTLSPNNEPICLFQGRLLTPVKLEGNAVALALTAAPKDEEKQLENLRMLQSTDPLFIPESKEDDPFLALQAQQKIFYYDRVTQRIGLSDLFEGNQFLDVGPNFYRDSLDLKPGEIPLAALEVTLEVQWIQRMRSYAQLSRTIARAFPEKIINTLTGKSFAKKWPKTGQSLGNSGYWVVSSHLEEITPPKTGMLNLYPTFSGPLWTASDDGTPVSTYVKRSWFQGRLLVGWNYKQKRKEKLTFTLKQDFDPLFKEGATPIEKIHLRLREISPKVPVPFWLPHKRYEEGIRVQEEGKLHQCLHSHTSDDTFGKDQINWRFEKNLPTALGDPRRASFFITPRGVQAFEYALEIAKTYLAHRARNLQISFTGSWALLASLTLDHTVRLEDPRLPGGALRGKVIHYTLIADGKSGERRVEVTLAVSGSSGTMTEDAPKGTPVPYAIDYMEATPLVQKSRGGISYETYEAQGPVDAFSHIHRFHAHKMLKHLALKNKAQEQEAHLQQMQYPQGSIASTTLKNHSTAVQLHFLPLTAKEAIEHTITAHVLSTWAAPRQLRL